MRATSSILIPLLTALPACYTQVGAGYAGGRAVSLQIAAGVVGHFGEAGSVRAGGALAVGGRIDGDRPRVVVPGPFVFGGHVRVRGAARALVVSGDVHAPFISGLRVTRPEETVRAPALRAFLGVGYRRDVLGTSPETDDQGRFDLVRRIEFSWEVTAGPELFWARSDPFGTDVSVGGAVSLLLELRGWKLAQMATCLVATHDDDRCRSRDSSSE